jgi:sulfatase maturation enzyme AslB (radical SAM superfamily)
MCSSYYSSSWIEDEHALNLPTRDQIKHTKHNRLIEDIDVTNLERIYFNGGEPLMTRDHINVLKYLIKHGDPTKIQVLYSTNGTFPITDEMTSLWSQFKGLDLCASIDGIGPVFEYVRFPGNWSAVEQNLISFKSLKSKVPNVFLTLSITIGVHNVLYFDQLYAWAQQHDYNLQIQNTNGRGQLALENFPSQHIVSLENYLDSLPDSEAKTRLQSMAKNITGADPRWAEYLNNLDLVRNNSWKTSLSRLYNLDTAYFDTFKTDYRGQPWKQMIFT